MMRTDLYKDLYVKEDTYWWHVGKYMIVEKLINRYWGRPIAANSAARLLDVGCGTGRILNLLQKYGQVWGLDSSPHALDFCRMRGFENVSNQDILAGLDFEPASFDVITALDVVEHLDNDRQGLINLGQLLKPGGVLIVSVPAYQLLFSYWDIALGHKRRYTARSLGRVVREAGLELEKRTYTNMAILPPAVAVRSLKALLKRLRRVNPEGSAVSEETSEDTDFIQVPPALNRFLIALYRVEAWLSAKSYIPFGLSVVAVCRRPASVAA